MQVERSVRTQTLALALTLLGACQPTTTMNPTDASVAAALPPLDTTGTERVIAIPRAVTGVEGIAIDPRTRSLFVGEWRAGAIFRAVLPRGDTPASFETFSPRGADGRSDVVGLTVDERRRRLVAAGGTDHHVYVYDIDRATLVAAVPLALDVGAIINDVAVAPDGTIFATVSAQTPVVYSITLEPQPRAEIFVDYSSATVIPVEVRDLLLNGLVASDTAVLVCHTSTGQLFRIDRATRAITELNTGRREVGRDGLAVVGDLLIAVDIEMFSSSSRERLTLTRLGAGWRTAVFERELLNAAFYTPTTLAVLDDRLYVLNAKFGAPPSALPFTVFSLPLPR
jgi:sugar lactone lactonase YvrE